MKKINNFKTFFLLAISLIVLVGLFVAFKPDSNDKSPEQQNAGNVISPPSKSFRLVIADGQLSGGTDLLQAIQGDALTIEITSDAADELHVHGYDKKVQLEAGKTAKVNFKADTSGRFEIELHEADSVVAVLEVQPKL